MVIVDVVMKLDFVEGQKIVYFVYGVGIVIVIEQ